MATTDITDERTTLTLPEVPESLRDRLEAGRAVAWSEPVQITTYEPDDPSPYPMYLDHRVYQGSSGRVYPLPFVERIASEPVVRTWQALHLENAYVRLVVLPELGGRIHIGYDKVTGYDFFYRNNVIKPALVGLTGPWISGGVELNWPQHHRPATFLPVETSIEERADGGVTVWCSDHEPFARMRGTYGVTLLADASLVQLDVRLHNRTPDRQTFLWWANVAARVHDRYQSFFPEDVHHVADHARRAITAFPQADRPYYNVDYPARAAAEPGADRIDFYRNIPVPTSYMILDTRDEFFGGYDHDAGAGFVHWADGRISPGKKQWTWGNAPFGHAWDRLLTDGDGPYVELMAGVYTDNQPDFSWIAPGETKRFTQFWYPIPAIGVAHQATPLAAVHVERGGSVSASFAVTSPRGRATARLVAVDGSVLAASEVDAVPGVPTRVDFGLPLPDGARVELVAADGALLVGWRAADPPGEEPATATAPPAPADISGVDELYLTGTHLLQYRHPTRSPLPYWEEALRRDPGDSRVRVALAELRYRAGDHDGAAEHLRAALTRVTARNTIPRDAEVYYLLGLVELRRGREREAAAALARAGWDAQHTAAAGFELACLAARRGADADALADLDELDAVARDDRRRDTLRVVLLRRLGRAAQAQVALARAFEREPLDPVLRHLADGSLVPDGASRCDVAEELIGYGENEAALAVLLAASAAPASAAGNVAPTAHYRRAWLLDRIGRPDAAAAARQDARAADLRWCFPSGPSDHEALVAAVAAEPADVVALGLLGTLRYDVGRREEALAHWEAAIGAGSEDPVVHRNAALAAYTVAHDDDRAAELYTRARQLDPSDPRLLFEQDQLAARLGEDGTQRLARFAADLPLVHARDDLVVEYADLLIGSGRAREALDLLESRTFQPWEGGEGRVLGAWDRARAELGLALADPPAALGEGRPLYAAPAARHDDGETDYFATSLPEMLLFARE